MSSLDDITVEVSLLTVLYAIRYGMGRLSYANSDASGLARRFWDIIPNDIQQQIVRDARALDPERRAAWAWLVGNEK